MKKQNGFTLIELVVVIAILGILAAIALPKFVNMTSEARIAKMKGAVGAVNSGAALIHAKWLAMGSPSSGTLTYEGGSIAIATELTNGYPTAAKIAEVAGIGDGYNTATAGTIADADKTTCHFTYAPPASAGAAPTITTVDPASTPTWGLTDSFC